MLGSSKKAQHPHHLLSPFAKIKATGTHINKNCASSLENRFKRRKITISLIFFQQMRYKSVFTENPLLVDNLHILVSYIIFLTRARDWDPLQLAPLSTNYLKSSFSSINLLPNATELMAPPTSKVPKCHADLTFIPSDEVTFLFKIHHKCFWNPL